MYKVYMDIIQWADKLDRIKLAINKYRKIHPRLFSIYASILLIFPIIIFALPMLLTGNKIPPGDGDYYIQLHEALRLSVFKYHQFPWWNPWIAGGIPLFANPQFGLISIQSVFVFIFGTVFGYKLALLAYIIIGFFGFKKLFSKVFKADITRSILLAYIWVFGSYVVYRLSGHYTFLMISFLPWAIYLFAFRAVHKNWLKLAILISFMIWTAIHYITILSILVLSVSAIVILFFQIIKRDNIKNNLLIFVSILSVIVLLSLPRLYFVAEYMIDYPRDQSNSTDPYIGLYNGVYGLFGIDQYHTPPTLDGPWGWMEASSSISFMLLLVVVYLIYIYIKSSKKSRASFTHILPFPIFILLIGFLFIVGLGDFGSLSPYHWLRQLPVFSSMRVAPRYIAWTAILILCLIAAVRLPKKQNLVINIMLTLGCVYLFISGIRVIGDNYLISNSVGTNTPAIIEQRKFWHNSRLGGEWHDENFTEATINNIGQIYAGDSLIDTRGPVPTSQCPIEDGCPFISNNATVTYWSPNKIIIKRNAPGPITLQMSPGARWRINGQYTFRDLKVVDPVKHFIINDPNDTIIIEYVPKFSPEWIRDQLTIRFKN